MEVVYAYLTGLRFRPRINAILERFTEMHQDLDRERKMITRASEPSARSSSAECWTRRRASTDVLMITAKGEAAE